jgi:hypothetical protein
MAAAILDKYNQVALFNTSGSVATSFQKAAQLITGISNLQKEAFVVSRLEYDLPVGWLTCIAAAAGKYISVGVSASDKLDQNLDLGNGALYDFVRVECPVAPAAMGGPFFHQFPLIHEWAPGNELLMLPQKLFLVLKVESSSNLTVVPVWLRMWYKIIELGPNDYFDLLQLRSPLGF